MKIYLESLGCPKNLTDTEVIMGLLASAGHKIITNKNRADIIILNTCAFISSAEKESIETAKRLAKLKKPLIIVGCFPQKHKNQAAKMIPGAAAYVGSSDIYRINEIIENLGGRGQLIASHGSCLFDHNFPRVKATPLHLAYVKIADGCDNRCAYCSIPSIRGKLKSRPMFSIIKEIKNLAKHGAKEIIFVAQDTTSYGKDLGIKDGLAKLCQKVARIEGIRWIRIMYAHPRHVTDKLIKVMAKEPKICKYLDLPIQHASDKILCLMRRHYSAGYIKNLINKIRRQIPKIALRTTVIVGHPGETEKDFAKLYEFIKENRFERLGVFTYEQEERTPAGKMRGQVPFKVKNNRFRKLKRLSAKISGELNNKLIGQELQTMIETAKNGHFAGRSFMDAPEIDGRVKVFGRNLVPGRIIKARVISSGAFDLAAKLIT